MLLLGLLARRVRSQRAPNVNPLKLLHKERPNSSSAGNLQASGPSLACWPMAFIRAHKTVIVSKTK